MEMGLCNLSELKQQRKISNKPWTESELLFILYSISRGLETARSLRIAHGDVKEKNIVVGEKSYMLADFGEAIYIPPDGILRNGLARGTKAYWAPELCKKFYDNSLPYMPEKTDVYALGVLMIRIGALKEDYEGPH